MPIMNVYWKFIGANDPYFGVLKHSRFRRKNITPDDRNAFFQIGRQDVEFIASHLSNIDAIESVLDFGCGVGRLSIALAAKFRNIVGVDISPGMLAEAIKNANDFGIANVRFVTDLPNEKFDLVVSYIVFQHIAAHHGIELLRKLLDRVRIGGQVAIQITLYRSSLVKKILIFMHDYDATEVLRIFFDAGFTSLSMVKTDHDGCIGAWIFGRRE